MGPGATFGALVGLKHAEVPVWFDHGGAFVRGGQLRTAHRAAMEKRMRAASSLRGVCSGGVALALLALLGWLLLLHLTPVRYGTDAAVWEYSSSEAAAADRARTLRRLSIPALS